MLPRLGLRWLILAARVGVGLWECGSQKSQIGIATAQQLSRHAEGHEVDKRALATARIAEQRQMGLGIEHGHGGEPLWCAVGEPVAIGRGFRALGHQCGVHRGQVEVPSRLLADALRVDTRQRHGAHMSDEPVEVGLTQPCSRVGHRRTRLIGRGS